MRKTGTVCFKNFKTGNEDINALLIRPHELYLTLMVIMHPEGVH